MKKTAIRFDKLSRTEDETAQEWVYRALRFAVMSGQVQPGLALTIRGIADMLDVSSMPVREALRRLTSEGALLLKANRRIMVPDIVPAKLVELIEMRILLECHAAERALPYVNDKKLDELKALNDEQNHAFEAPDPEGIILNNLAFHKCLYSAHPFPACIPMIEQIWLQLGPLHRLALANFETHYIKDRHIEIMQALKTHNSFGLKAAIEADIRDGAGYMTQTELLERYNRAETDNLSIPGHDYIDRLGVKS
ncbi:GntR family transcriptional regulator [Kordiimonas pumila]|uniref:GntR family transcriptional regulator n=1 Tax=Kordiimonas pumila TaxID=2161677 RepID=A0ABV7D3K1_9PROT|nr:GntR family transcriptional regulator [Kordiimonas pumila]